MTPPPGLLDLVSRRKLRSPYTPEQAARLIAQIEEEEARLGITGGGDSSSGGGSGSGGSDGGGRGGGGARSRGGGKGRGRGGGKGSG